MQSVLDVLTQAHGADVSEQPQAAQPLVHAPPGASSGLGVVRVPVHSQVSVQPGPSADQNGAGNPERPLRHMGHICLQQQRQMSTRCTAAELADAAGLLCEEGARLHAHNRNSCCSCIDKRMLLSVVMFARAASCL